MIGTLLSFLFALIAVYIPGNIPSESLAWVIGLMIFISAITLIALVLLYSIAWFPLQKVEFAQTPRVLELMKKDWRIGLATTYLLLFPLITLGFNLDFLLYGKGPEKWLLALWIVLFGFALDCIHMYLKCIQSYLNRFEVVSMFTSAARKSILTDKEMELCGWIDALGEVGVKALGRSGTSLANETIDELEKIAKIFLESMKSIGHPSQDKESKAAGIKDKVSFTLFFLFQRLEAFSSVAANKKIEAVCSKLVTSLGKITIHSAKYDMTLAAYPIHYLGKTTMLSQEHGIKDTSVKAILTLLEVAREIIDEIDLKYTEMKDPFIALINTMDEISKETFKSDKMTNIGLLKEPFLALKKLFDNPKVSSHQDTPAIVANIDRVIDEFNALEMVMKSLPPMPTIQEAEAAPYPEPPKPAREGEGEQPFKPKEEKKQDGQGQGGEDRASSR